MSTTTPSEQPTRDAAAALAGVETGARSVAEAAHAPTQGITGAQSLVRSLEAVGVEVVFGIPGGAILPLYDPLFDSKVRHVLVRHEQGAGHAATGYAQATGRVGVCMATSGPGATNLVTPLADAYMDSVPIVAITGQVPSGAIGTDAFQEADIRGITMPVTKHNFLVTDAAEIPQRIAEAFHLASTGRPGPVLVDVPKDILQATTDFAWPPRLDLPGYKPTTRPHGKQVREAAALIAGASPAGPLRRRRRAQGRRHRGARRAGAPDRRPRGHHADGPRRLPRQRPAAPGDARHARHRRRGHRAAEGRRARRPRRPVRRPGHRQPVSFAPDALVVHADIDPAEIGKNRKADVPIVGDARETIAELVTAVRAEHEAGPHAGPGRLVGAAGRLAHPLPARLRLARGRRAVPAVRHRAAGRDRRPGRDLHLRRRPAPDVGRAVHQVREARHLAQQRRPRHDGLRRAGGHGRQVRPPGDHGVGHRRRRLLPDDQPGAGHLRHRGHPDQGRRHQQRQPRHGPAVADPLLRGPLLQHQAARGRRERRPHAGPHPRLRRRSPRRWAASGCAASPRTTWTP